MFSLTKILIKRNLKPLRLLCNVQFHHTDRKCLSNISKLQEEYVPVFHRATQYFDDVALRDNLGSYTYGNLSVAARALSKEISRKLDKKKKNSQVLFVCPNNASYVITQWAIWMSGHVAVPISSLHPQSMIEYYANDCACKLLITTPEYSEVMHNVSKSTKIDLMVLDNNLRADSLTLKAKVEHDSDIPKYYDVYNTNAMIIYTSGTTGYPKGVVLTHKNIISQITTLVDAWKWTSNDVILHVLPLHHIHGIVNALLCPLYIGAKCIMLPKFDANDVWAHLLGVKSLLGAPKINVFMAVPTIYTKLIDEYENLFHNDPKIYEYIKNTLETKVRLMVSGSAPLPVPLYEKWLNLTGHRLLERYGMSEIGMCLSQKYESEREPGFVGVPLNGCSVRLSQKNNDGSYRTLMECTNTDNCINIKYDIEIPDDNVVGELHVLGNSVFKEYYNKPDITRKEFTNDMWFKTGDTCLYSSEKKLFKILGRTSLDIIKTGGYKVSALEIETQLLGHPNIVDCAVVGLPDEQWGQIVAAAVVLRKEISTEALQLYIKNKIASYSVPKIFKIVKTIPKNAMGKVNKKDLAVKVFLNSTEFLYAKN